MTYSSIIKKIMRDIFEIKPATSADIPLILSFINELAEYEKLSHEVVATEALLKQTLFNEKSVAFVIIGYLNHIPISFAIYFYNFSTFLGRPGIYLEDLYVRPNARGKGIGQRMLAYLAHIAKEKNCGRLEWQVLDWNKDAIGFYERIGAKAVNDWTLYRLAGDALESVACTWADNS